MSACTACGRPITWRRIGRLWRPYEAETVHRCPAYARERARGYAVDPARVARERAVLDELYGDGEEGT